MEVNYKEFSQTELEALTPKEFREILKSNGYDKLKFLQGSFYSHEYARTLRKHFSRRFVKKAPLKALFLYKSFRSGITDSQRACTFLGKLLDQQNSSLETLELVQPLTLTTKVCRKINKWMKSKQIIRFALQGVCLSDKDFQEIFKVELGGGDIRVKELRLISIPLSARCLLKLTHLTRLELRKTISTDFVWDELCALIERTNALEALIVSRITATRARAILLGKAVAQNKSIERLDLHEEVEMIVPMINYILQSESLTQFNLRPAVYPYDKNLIISALREALPSAKASLTSLDLAKTPIPDDIFALLDIKAVKKKKGNKLLNSVVDKLNGGSTTTGNAFKTMLIGSASDILFGEILNQPKIDPGFQKYLLDGRDPVVILHKDGESDITHNLAVGVGVSDQVHATMMLHSLEQQVTEEIQEESTKQKPNENQNVNTALTLNDIVRYQTTAGYDDQEPKPTVPLRVNNMWPGINLGDVQVPFVHRAQEKGGVYLASFLVSKILYSDFAEEFRRLTWLAHQVPDSVQIVLVGLFDASLSEETLGSFNFDFDSLKIFLSNKMWELLPQRLRKKLGSKYQLDEDANKPQDDNIVFLDCPLAQNNATKLNALWRTIDINLPTMITEVDARWYIVLTTLKTDSKAPSAYTKFSALSEVAKASGVNDNDVWDMVNYFEESGELLVLSAKPNEYEANSLVVFDKLWLKSKLEPISSEAQLSKNSPHAGIWANMYRKTLWENEEEWVSDILSKHAETLGLLIKLEEGGWLLPYANANSRHTSLKKEKYINSKPLFWIEIPRHHRKLEVFRLFSTKLLNILVNEKQLTEAKHLMWRDSTSMGYALQQTDDYAWARCDTSSNRILFGVPEPLFEVFKSFVDPVRQALKETVEFMSSYDEQSSVSNSEVDDQELKRYPHLIFRMVGENNEVVEQPDINIDDATPPKELSAAVDHPFLKDIALISFSKCPYVNFIASVLQLEGLSVDQKENIAADDNYTYRLVVVLLGEDEKENAKSVLEGRKEKFLVRSMKENNLSFYKEEVSNACKSLENAEKPEAGLNELIVDVLKELGYQ